MGFALSVYALFCAVLLQDGLRLSGGHLGYPLDDTYIHAAMARHFVQQGVWGVTQEGFTSSTSSPLWTLLLALAYRLGGVNEWAPLALNLVCGGLVVGLCFFLLRQAAHGWRLAILLSASIILTPLPILALSGMEHTLHSLLTIWFLWEAAAYLSDPTRAPRRLWLLAALLCATRYEGLFLAGLVSLALCAARRWRAAFLLGAAGVSLVSLYGLIALSQGWEFLPNGVWLKGNTPAAWQGTANFWSRFTDNWTSAPHLPWLAAAGLFVFAWGEQRGLGGKKERYRMGLWLAAVLLHLQFASVGWFYRYEGYLILAGCVLLAELLARLLDSLAESGWLARAAALAALAGAAWLCLGPLAGRTQRALRDYPLAVKNIYEQQYQMGLFVQRYYQGKAVAANDIGAINYLADLKLLDLYGLGSLEVAQAKRRGEFDREQVRALGRAHQVEIIIIYNTWFEGKIPEEWQEVGQWQISDNVVCGSDTVSFYAPDASRREEIRAQLEEFGGSGK